MTDGVSVVTSNGIFYAVLLLEGRAVGTWVIRDDVLRLTVATALSSTVLQSITQEASDVGRFLHMSDPLVMTVDVMKR